MHKAREHQQPLFMCFVEFKKAFDSISHDKLWAVAAKLVNGPWCKKNRWAPYSHREKFH